MTLSPPWCASSHLCAHLGALPVKTQTVTHLLAPASQTRILGSNLHHGWDTHGAGWSSMQKSCAMASHAACHGFELIAEESSSKASCCACAGPILSRGRQRHRRV